MLTTMAYSEEGLHFSAFIISLVLGGTLFAIKFS